MNIIGEQLFPFYPETRVHGQSQDFALGVNLQIPQGNPTPKYSQRISSAISFKRAQIHKLFLNKIFELWPKGPLAPDGPKWL